MILAKEIGIREKQKERKLFSSIPNAKKLLRLATLLEMMMMNMTPIFFGSKNFHSEPCFLEQHKRIIFQFLETYLSGIESSIHPSIFFCYFGNHRSSNCFRISIVLLSVPNSSHQSFTTIQARRSPTYR